ncbi:MAG: RpiB/LacA/LacB family sugar-phosphate isomerase [Verrucomicrobiota bacterium]|nr:RpiB/LacA/LacB family sugar-phosphate isomerase [Verrucomicrobiota bacterium]
MKVALASDHAGYDYKQKVLRYLEDSGLECLDFGTHESKVTVDYPDYIGPAAKAVSKGQCDIGLIFGGSGNGEAMVANKIPGVRCAVCWNEESALLSRQHNDANIISIGQRIVPEVLLLPMIKLWIETAYEGGRHDKRLQKMKAAEAAAEILQIKIPIVKST